MSLLIVISALLIVFPLIEQENLRNTLNKNPLQAGSTFIYCFNSFAEYDYSNYRQYPQFNLTNGLIGTLILKVNSNNTIEVNKCVFPDEYGVTKPIFSNGTYGENAQVVKWFINDISLSTPFVNINGVINKKGNSGLCYHGGARFLQPTFDQAYYSQLIKDNGYTTPTVLNAININEFGLNTSREASVFHTQNKFCYDQAGNYNVLVGTSLCGNVSLVRTLCNNQNVFLSEDFQLILLNTNVGLHPLSKERYLLPYAQYVMIIWLIGVPILYVTIKAAKKRVTKNKR